MIRLSVYRKAVRSNREAYDAMNTPGDLTPKQREDMNRKIDDANGDAYDLFAECGIRKSDPDSPLKYEKQGRILDSVNRSGGVSWKI